MFYHKYLIKEGKYRLTSVFSWKRNSCPSGNSNRLRGWINW